MQTFGYCERCNSPWTLKLEEGGGLTYVVLRCMRCSRVKIYRTKSVSRMEVWAEMLWGELSE